MSAPPAEKLAYQSILHVEEELIMCWKLYTSNGQQCQHSKHFLNANPGFISFHASSSLEMNVTVELTIFWLYMLSNSAQKALHWKTVYKLQILSLIPGDILHFHPFQLLNWNIFNNWTSGHKEILRSRNSFFSHFFSFCFTPGDFRLIAQIQTRILWLRITAFKSIKFDSQLPRHPNYLKKKNIS